MKKILFVCTGNTCRSPMAEAVFNYKANKLGICASAQSAGLFADGSPMSEYAAQALNEAGIPHAMHISRTVSQTIARDADIIIGMSSAHAAKLCSAFPELSEKIMPFPCEIADPFCGSYEVYRHTLEQIAEGTDLLIARLFGGSE